MLKATGVGGGISTDSAEPSKLVTALTVASLALVHLRRLPFPLLYWLSLATIGRLEERAFRTRLPVWRTRLLDTVGRFDLTAIGITDAEHLVERHLAYVCRRSDAEQLVLYLKLQDAALSSRIRGPVELLRKQAPAVLAMPHIGAMTILPVLLAAFGFPVSVTALESNLARLNRVERIARLLAPEVFAQVEPLTVENRGVLIKAAAALRRGRFVCVYPDFPYWLWRIRSTHVNLAGGFIRVPIGAAVLAGKLRVPLIPVALASLGNGYFELLMGQQIFPSDNDAENRIEATQRLFTEIEAFLREFPEQWMGWHHYSTFQSHAAFPGADASPAPSHSRESEASANN